MPPNSRGCAGWRHFGLAFYEAKWRASRQFTPLYQVKTAHPTFEADVLEFEWDNDCDPGQTPSRARGLMGSSQDAGKRCRNSRAHSG